MKRVNLLDYFELAESLQSAKRALNLESAKAGNIFFALMGLPHRLHSFINDDNGFSTCKRVANELIQEVNKWNSENAMPNGEFSAELFEKELPNWNWTHILRRIDTFRSVFEAECHDVDVYSVGQIAIYKTRDLIANASHKIPAEFRDGMPQEALTEFDNAGRCLAFDLPTACGFHALRGTELVMDSYLKAFGITKKLVSWNEYIKAAEELASRDGSGPKPSKKVTAMLDRMKSLDRNPLMHPRDELDNSGADQLFSLATITVAEMIRDMRTIKGPTGVALIAASAGAELPQEKTL
ncbi:hypothetical protein [Agrobacterium vitis]|uniref:hypothetical protein n=1 Tax=Agrobacterium vitis TaxID=373 RepID=UPI00157198EB|nr:hypothetical protein [Agrobacterium vitis]NSZ16099.1 hypothetical protein [Agrobacterium vitis]QZO04874.1 hypothetical protein K4831_04875 [Agrobacterium vitis]UJL87019.1 hypothetical protein AVF2S5_03210 [Agrobacterium vitis]